jgi:diacylglycerol kinase family enzyme
MDPASAIRPQKSRVQTVRRRVVLVVNPHASRVSSRLRDLIGSALSTRFEVVQSVTESKGHATRIAQDAVSSGADAVIAFGGDGTANEVANGLANSEVALTCLPGGSANVFCGVLGMPRDVVAAARHLMTKADDWTPRAVDAGSVNGRRFLFNSGVGLDASIVRGVDARPDLKARWRQWWFVTQAGRTLAGDYALDPPRVRIVEQEGSGGIAVIVQNGRPWTYFADRPITVSKNADLESGSLTASIVGRPRPWDYVPLGWRAFSGRGAEGHPRVPEYQADSFTVVPVNRETIALHVDGDPLGEVSSARFEVEPRALTVIS